jgi:hypothetical protein
MTPLHPRYEFPVKEYTIAIKTRLIYLREQLPLLLVKSFPELSPELFLHLDSYRKNFEFMLVETRENLDLLEKWSEEKWTDSRKNHLYFVHEQTARTFNYIKYILEKRPLYFAGCWWNPWFNPLESELESSRSSSRVIARVKIVVSYGNRYQFILPDGSIFSRSLKEKPGRNIDEKGYISSATFSFKVFQPL